MNERTDSVRSDPIRPQLRPVKHSEVVIKTEFKILPVAPPAICAAAAQRRRRSASQEMERPWNKDKHRPSTTQTASRSFLSKFVRVIVLSLIFLVSVFLAHFQLYGRSSHPNFSSVPPTRLGRDCDASRGRWAKSSRPFRYNASCPFHRNAWNCLRNGREGMNAMNSWVWIPDTCGDVGFDVGFDAGFDPAAFLSAMRGRRIGFVGDSLNENFLVAFLCILRSADDTARKWKKKKAWRGGYFPLFDVIVAYHRAVLLSRYQWQPAENTTSPSKTEVKGFYRVDVDVPADDWVNITNFYDILVFNTGHWWGPDKFPKETPLVFYKSGQPILPPLSILEGLEVVVNHTVDFIAKEIPSKTLKFWRSQSPRHFHGGEWNQNGSCLFDEPLKENQLDSWFEPRNRGVNKEAREINRLIWQAVQETDIHLLNITHMSEFRADAHPAIWLGTKDAVKVWGQDCLHWCLPGLPDTWVDVLVAQIMYHLRDPSRLNNL
ncbi:trichome birefringence-like protein (DUF828) [Wolffia australiana]